MEKSEGTPCTTEVDHATSTTQKMTLKAFSVALIIAICFNVFISASEIPRSTSSYSFSDYQDTRLSPESLSILESKNSELKVKVFGPWEDHDEFNTFKAIISRRSSGSNSPSSNSSPLIKDESDILDFIMSFRPFTAERSNSGGYSSLARLVMSNSKEKLVDSDMENNTPRTLSKSGSGVKAVSSEDDISLTQSQRWTPKN